MYLAAGGSAGLAAAARKLGLRHTSIGVADPALTTMSASDGVRLLHNLVAAGPARHALARLRPRHDAQRAGRPAVGRRRARRPGTARSRTRTAGWTSTTTTNRPRTTADRWLVDSLGVVRAHGQQLLVAVFTRHNADFASGVGLVEKLARLSRRPSRSRVVHPHHAGQRGDVGRAVRAEVDRRVVVVELGPGAGELAVTRSRPVRMSIAVRYHASIGRRCAAWCRRRAARWPVTPSAPRSARSRWLVHATLQVVPLTSTRAMPGRGRLAEQRRLRALVAVVVLGEQRVADRDERVLGVAGARREHRRAAAHVLPAARRAAVVDDDVHLRVGVVGDRDEVRADQRRRGARALRELTRLLHRAAVVGLAPGDDRARRSGPASKRYIAWSETTNTPPVSSTANELSMISPAS